MEMTEMQRKMDAACGHQVEVRLVEGRKTFIGRCINYTPPYDNEPEVASMDIAVPSKYADTGRQIYEIFEDEIENIIIKD